MGDMTLAEIVEELPGPHSARREYAELIARVLELEKELAERSAPPTAI